MNITPRKVAVVGSGGLFGSAIVRVFRTLGDKVVALDLPDADMTAPASLEVALEKEPPDILVNAAGIGDLDWLQDRPNTARNVHVRGTVHLRNVAERFDAFYVHISCRECVSGRSVFAESKREAENEAARLPQHLILRCSTLFGPSGERSGKHLVETILNASRRVRRFSVIDDLRSSPTYTLHLARALRELIEQGRTGLHTLGNSGSATPMELVRELARQTGIALEVTPISRDDFGHTAPRSPDTSLPEPDSLSSDSDFPVLPHWTEALRQYLDDRQTAW